MKAQQEGGDQDTIYTNMLHREQQRRASRRLRLILGKTLGTGLNKVTVVDESGDPQDLTNKHDIEQACHRSNEAKFSQTNMTPPMQGKLCEDLEYLGISPAC